MEGIFFDITVVLAFATVLALIFKLIKQPPTLAYILAGILVGPLGLIQINDVHALESFAEIGITLLLFMLGLELKLSELRSVGKVALITGISQIVFTSLVGFVIAMALGFATITSLYIAIGLTFSSTIIIVKLLSDKKDLNSLYGKISIGFLLVQDFCAIIALVVLAGIGSSEASGIPPWGSVLLVTLKAIIIFAVVIYLSQSIFPRLIHKISDSRELLFLFSLAWAFGLSMFISSDLIGLSIEIGGFMAGLALANSAESFQIVTKIRSLRDFFITIFFVTLGMNLAINNFVAVFTPAMIFSVFVLLGNPIIVMMILGAMGYRKKTSFSAGLSVAQISEFSLIVMFMGKKLGHLGDEIVSLMTLVAIITFTLSTYAILNDRKIYKILEKYLTIFERKKITEKNLKGHSVFKNHIIIVGAHRVGMNTLINLKKYQEQVVVVDFNPDIIDQLEEMGFKYVFGDIADADVQEKLNINKAKMIFSTVPDVADNIILVNAIKNTKSKAKIVVILYQQNKDMDDLYESGVDYIVLPHMLAGELMAKILVKEDYKKLESINTKAQLSPVV
jgi:Kef-type K+ transport system membrane component KefB